MENRAETFEGEVRQRALPHYRNSRGSGELKRRSGVQLVCIAALTLGACSAEEVKPLRAPDFGTVVGQVLTSDGEDLVPVAGALVEIYGTSVRARTTGSSKFVLTPVPLGDHVLVITDAASGRSGRANLTLASPFQTLELSAEKTTLEAPASIVGKVSVSGGSSAGATVFLVGGNAAQLSFVGDDGSYVLGSLPQGTLSIGYALAGHDPVRQTVEVTGPNTSAADVTLNASSASGLGMKGIALLADQTVHGGTVVLLDGTEVSTTTVDGAFDFSGLAPGQHSLVAQRAGYKSIRLPNIALAADGVVSGLPATLYMSPGQDDNGAAGDIAFDVRITSPTVGATVEAGSEVTLLAAIKLEGESIPPSRVVWRREGLSPVYASVEIGRGDPLLVDDLPIGLHLLSVTATSDNGRVASHQSTFEVTPLDIDVAILSHTFNDSVISQVPVIFGADVTYSDGTPVADALISWGYRPSGSVDPLTPLGLGRTTTVLFDAVDDIQTVDIVVEVDLQGSRVSGGLVGVFLEPFLPAIELGSDLPDAIDAPATTSIIDAGTGEVLGTEYSLFQGQPVTLAVNMNIENIVWNSDTGILVSGGRLDLSVLPLGTHNFTLSLNDGQVSSDVTLRIIVQPFTFTVTITAPVPNPATPYTVFSGVPLVAQVSHPYQRTFPLASLRWFLLQGGEPTVNVAQGLSTRTFALPIGPGQVRFQVTDALNQVAFANADYVQQDISFTADIIQPGPGLSVIEGTPIDFQVSYSHNLITADNFTTEGQGLTVRYFSDLQGLLLNTTAGGDVFDFPMLTENLSTVSSFSNLLPGQHTITARLSRGTDFTEATRTLTVRSTGVAASLIAPQDESIFFQGDALNLTVNASADGAITPVYTWTIDGTEFTSEGGYNSLLPTSSARTTLNLGNVGTGALVTSGVWAPGRHVIRFSMQIEGQEQAACLNIPTKTVCLTFAIDIAPPDVDLCPSTAIRTITGTEVWSGVVRLNCSVEVNGPGARLEILPGTRILVTANRVLDVREGELIVGASGSVPEVVFTAPPNSPTAYWLGIGVSPIADSSTVTVKINNTTIRNAQQGVRATSRYGKGPHVVELFDVSFENSKNGIFQFCPTAHGNLSFRGISSRAIDVTAAYGCGASMTWADLLIEDSSKGIRLRYPTNIIVERLVARNIGDGAILVDTGSVRTVEVRDSVFENVNADYTFYTGAITMMAGCHTLTATGNTFIGSGRAIYTGGCTSGYSGARRLGIFGNVFKDNIGTVIQDQNTVDRAVEIHLNAFIGDATYIRARNDGVDIQAQGNFMGEKGDVTKPGGAVFAQLAGVLGNLPLIADFYDNPGDDRVVRVDNPLPTGFSVPQNAPLTYIAEPQHGQKYNASLCVPLRVGVPMGGLDPATDCVWYFGKTTADPVLTPDADGCIDTSAITLNAGVHDVTLECTVYDSNRVALRSFVHSTSFRVSNTVSGRQWRTAATWSGDVELDGDYTIPAGYSLTIDPGTTIKVALSDALRYGRQGTFPIDNSVNVGLGSRNLVELWVDGSMQVNGSVNAEVRLQAVSGVDLGGQWGGLRVQHGTGLLQMDYVRISGAGRAVQGLYKYNEPGSAPSIDLRNVSFVGVQSVVRGVCPRVFEDILVDGAAAIFEKAHCPTQLTIDRATFTNIGGNANTRFIELDDYYTGGPVTQFLSMRDVSFDRGIGTRSGYAVSLMSASWNLVQIDNSHFKDFLYLFDFTGNNTAPDSFVVTGSKFENFDFLFQTHNYWDVINIDNSVFNNGQRLFNNGSTAAINVSFTNNRVTDVDYVFSVNDFGSTWSVTQLNMTGNHFENPERVFYVRVNSGLTNASYAATLSNNNFVGLSGSSKTASVLLVSSIYLAPETQNNVFSVDITNSYFDGLSSVDAMNTALGDSTSVAGRSIDYSGFVTTSLLLTVPDANVVVPR